MKLFITSLATFLATLFALYGALALEAYASREEPVTYFSTLWKDCDRSLEIELAFPSALLGENGVLTGEKIELVRNKKVPLCVMI